MSDVLPRAFARWVNRAAGTAVILSMTGCSLEEVDLSKINNRNPGGVSYLLVDNSGRLQLGPVTIIDKIDGVTPDTEEDSALYVIESGHHEVIFSLNESATGAKVARKDVNMTAQPGRYYQISFDNENGEWVFHLGEVDAEKANDVLWRERMIWLAYISYLIERLSVW